MKILNCHIDGFGRFIDTDFSFEDGLNTLCRKNGFGKTTLAVFIKAMLYGLPATTKRDLKENERKHYKPWRASVYGGAMELEANGRRYRIERRFGAKEKDDTLTVYDLETGKVTDILTDCPGDALFEVDAEGFERSIYISQRAPHAKLNTPTIQSKLGALLDDSEDLGDYQSAYDLLLQRARSYQTTGERGSIYDLKRSLARKDEEIAASEAAALSAATLREEIALHEKEKREAQESLAEIKKENARRASQNEVVRRQAEAQNDYWRLSEAVGVSEKREAALLAFFGGQVPSDETLSEMEAALLSYEAAEGALAAHVLSEDLADRRESLRKKYRNAPLSRSLLIGFRESLQLLREKERALTLSAPKPDAEWEKNRVRFEEMTSEKRERIEALQASLTSEGGKGRRSKPALLLPSIIGAVFFLVLSLGFFFASLPVLAFVSLGLLAASATLAAVLASKSGKAEENEALLRLKELLLPFGVLPTLADVRVFLHEYDSFIKKEEALAAEEKAHAQSKALLDDAFAEFASTLAPYGEGFFEEVLEAMGQDLAVLESIEAEEKGIKEKRERAEAVFSTEKKRLALLVEPYPISNLSYRQLLSELRTKRALLDEVRRQLTEGREALTAFCEQKGFYGEAAMPDTPQEELALLDEAPVLLTIEELTAAIAAKDKEATFLEDKAFYTEIHKEEKKRLAEALAEEESTYRALEAARELLTAAKESLSTRYLSGMEESFANRMAALSTDTLPYHFDTELSLSAEKEGARRPTDLLSTGEADLALFAARIALVDTIFKKEAPVLILDDPFVNLDKENLARANALLQALAKEMQILYFVCREA